MHSFESRLYAALGKPQALYLAAVSGGADSSAMLAGLAALRKEAGFVLHCAHVEHGIRPAEESRGDAQAVEALCGRLEVPCRVVSVTPGRIAAFASESGSGLEAAARVFRRKILLREAGRIGAAMILTGHTRGDLLETLLMRILRGSGPAGLAPMPLSRGRFLRPLLDLTRQDVLEYLKEKDIPYRTDSTNSDMRFLRNRVRCKLIPLLDEFFPFWRNSLMALAETQSLTADFLASEIRGRLPWESVIQAAGGGAALRLREEDFLNAPAILREEAVFAGADMLALMHSGGAAGSKGKICKRFQKTPRRAAVRRAAEKRAAAEDLGPVRLARKNGYIEMAPALLSGGDKGFSLLINKAGSYTLKGRVLGIRKSSGLLIRAGDSGGGACLPCGKPMFCAKLPLVFRNHRDGDCMYRGGHKRRLSAIIDYGSRSEFAGFITAVDPFGVAAFIGVSGKGPDRGKVLLIDRDGAAVPGGSESFFFEIS